MAKWLLAQFIHLLDYCYHQLVFQMGPTLVSHFVSVNSGQIRGARIKQEFIKTYLVISHERFCFAMKIVYSLELQSHLATGLVVSCSGCLDYLI